MTFMKSYLESCAKLHKALASHDASDETLSKLHSEHATLLDGLAAVANTEGGGDVPVGADFKAALDAEFSKRFGAAASAIIPDTVRGVGLTEEAAQIETAGLRLITRPGQTEGGVTPNTGKLVEANPFLEKFV